MEKGGRAMDEEVGRERNGSGDEDVIGHELRPTPKSLRTKPWSTIGALCVKHDIVQERACVKHNIVQERARVKHNIVHL